MSMKSIIVSACAAMAMILAGCGPSKEEKEKAEKDVEFYRGRLTELKPYVEDIVNVSKNGKSPEDKDLAKKWAPLLDRTEKLLSAPPDIKQLDDLKATSEAIGDAKKVIQGIVDKATDEVRRANESLRNAADAVRKFDEQHGTR